MRKQGKRGNLKSEDLERRLAPGRLGYVEPPEPTSPGGGGSSPVSEDPIRDKKPEKGGPKGPRVIHRD